MASSRGGMHSDVATRAQRTLFRKYLKITTLIVMAAFVFLGAIMMVFISRYWYSERQQLLRQNAEGVANIASKSLLGEENNTFTIDGERMSEFVSAFSENIGAYIVVTDVEGNIVLAHRGSNTNIAQTNLETNPKQDQKISQDIINQVIREGSYSATGSLGGYFDDDDCSVVGVPIVVTSSSGVQMTIGTTFAASSTAMLSGYRVEIVKMFFLAAVAALLVAFGVTWIFSYKMTRPLRDMVDATKSFSMGDFSVRVPVYSDDEIGELGTAFNQMAETLASSETMNRNFIANVSHELKTPMTTISGFVDGIMDGTIPPEKQNYYLGIVSTEVKRLSRLVKTMLDLSRIDSGKMVLHRGRFDISNTIFMALLSFENRIEEKQIEIRGLEDFDPLFVDGDPDMIHQVLYNLLENAVKFTDEGGYIEIHAKESGNRVTVSIRNSGPGISPEDVKLIFDRFYKTDKSRSKDKTGMGLGLYIVKTMVQLHGGEIRAESVENEYTLFEFWIPRHEKGEKRDKKTTKTVIRGKDNRIEVIDAGEIDVTVTPAEPEAPVEILDITDYTIEPVPEDAEKETRNKE